MTRITRANLDGGHRSGDSKSRRSLNTSATSAPTTYLSAMGKNTSKRAWGAKTCLSQ